MKIVNSTLEDVAAIFHLYEEATAYMKKMKAIHWLGFERSLVEQEIEEKRQWKILVDGQIACVFVVCFSDAALWGEKNGDLAVYIHRIATNPLFRGHSFVKHIVDWAKQYAVSLGKKYVRLDTGAGNPKLNNYYTSCGFTYMGAVTLAHAEDLPLHYQGASFSLFEMPASVSRGTSIDVPRLTPIS